MRSSEKEFQETVIELAVIHHWIVGFTYDARKSRAGEPDLRMVHPTKHRMINAELKTEGGKLTKGRWGGRNGNVWMTGQDEWKEALEACPGVEYYLWMPSQWDDIEQVLSR